MPIRGHRRTNGARLSLKHLALLYVVSLVLICPLASAKTLYRWVDSAGNVTYQDYPPPQHAESTLNIDTTSRTIYKRVDDQGVVTYQDQPQPGAKVMVDSHTHDAPTYSMPSLEHPAESRPHQSVASPATHLVESEGVQRAVIRGLLPPLGIAVLLVVYRLFFHAKVKGWMGEQLVALALRRLAYPALHDIVLLCEDGHPTQIDHVAKTPSGLLVIETKNYSGKIYGKSDDKMWTVCLGGTRRKMQNPLRQNYRHIQAVKRLVPDVPVLGHVVFAGSAAPPDGLGGQASSLSDFVDWAEALRTTAVSEDLLQSAWIILTSHARSDRESRNIHLASLRARFGSTSDT